MALNSEVFRYFFDNATIGIKIMEPNGIIVYANNAELDLIGLKEEELIGRHFSDFLPDKDRAETFFGALKKLENVDEFYTKLIRRDNSQIDVIIDSSINIREGVLESVCCFTRDITDYKRNEELLHLLNTAGSELASTYNTQAALDTIGKLIVPDFANWFSIDVVRNGKIELLKLAHQNQEHVEWAYAYRKAHPVTLDDEFGIGKVLRTGKFSFTPVVDEILINNSGYNEKREKALNKLQPQSVIIVPMFVKDILTGAITFINTDEEKYFEVADLRFAQDFANRIGLALENARLYEEAQAEITQRIEAEQKKDDFISMASHELKTPLTSIKAYTQILEKKLIDNVEAVALTKKAIGHIHQLERLISDLLDVSKINAGKLTYNITEFNFGAVLEESVESVQHLTNSHKIIIEETVNVPYRGDQLRIEQVITNFLTNAIKYSPNADQVIVKAKVESGNVVVAIQDFGIGIARENLHKLFERFYRVNSSAMKYSGLGLGLFIAAEILYRHDGSFWIESKENEGSTFFFRLPLNVICETETVHNKTFYKDNFIEVEYKPTDGWIQTCWNGYQTFKSVKHGGQVILDMLKENKCSKVLNDNSKVYGNWSEAADEGREIWFPAMEKAGLKHYAWIQSSSTFSQLAASKSVSTTLQNVEIKFFYDFDSATEWLRSVN